MDVLRPGLMSQLQLQADPVSSPGPWLSDMRSPRWASAAALAYSATATATSSLSDICTVAYAKDALPLDVLQGVTVDPSSVSTNLVTNFTASSIFYPTSTFDYCNLTFAYSHNGIDGDIVHVQYWLPAPGQFKNRYVSTGGGGWAINSGSSSIPTGVIAGGQVTCFLFFPHLVNDGLMNPKQRWRIDGWRLRKFRHSVQFRCVAGQWHHQLAGHLHVW